MTSTEWPLLLLDLLLSWPLDALPLLLDLVLLDLVLQTDDVLLDLLGDLEIPPMGIGDFFLFSACLSLEVLKRSVDNILT